MDLPAADQTFRCVLSAPGISRQHVEMGTAEMNRLWNSPLGLLLLTGGLLGLSPPFGKMATGSGIPAVLWAFVISFGAGSALLCVLLARRKSLPFTPRTLRYFIITGLISYAAPNILMFSAVPHLGAGYAGIMFTLSPVITLMLSLLFGVRRPNPLGIAGIAVGFIGALVVAATRGEAGQPADLLWVFVGLLIPVSLAAGNIYRTVDWPEGSGPIELAVGSNLAAAAMLFLALFVSGQGGSLTRLPEAPFLVLAQVTAAASMFAVFFRLQVVGGPVYLSQIGYVAAAVGLLIGVFFLGERYAIWTWIGAAIITAGVVMTTKAQSSRPSG